MTDNDKSKRIRELLDAYVEAHMPETTIVWPSDAELAELAGVGSEPAAPGREGQSHPILAVLDSCPTESLADMRDSFARLVEYDNAGMLRLISVPSVAADLQLLERKLLADSTDLITRATWPNAPKLIDPVMQRLSSRILREQTALPNGAAVMYTTERAPSLVERLALLGVE